jgi:hypothetical protein
MTYAAAQTAFPNLRLAVREEYESLSDYELADVVARTVGMSAADAEGWLSNLGRTFTQFAPGIAQGALSGALGGAALGPVGAIGGAILGGVGGALGAGGGGRPAAPGGTAGAPAAGGLLQLLGNPTVRQALFSMLLGPSLGRPSVPVGATGTPVPVGAFANLIREAADQALDQYETVGGFAEGREGGESMPEYLTEAKNNGADVGNALVRGVVLAKLLEQPTYVPVAPMAVAPVQYAPTQPPPGQPATAAMPPAAAPTAFEPAPQYGTPDLGIGRPLMPTQSEAVARQLAEQQFQETLTEVFELNGSAL